MTWSGGTGGGWGTYWFGTSASNITITFTTSGEEQRRLVTNRERQTAMQYVESVDQLRSMQPGDRVVETATRRTWTKRDTGRWSYEDDAAGIGPNNFQGVITDRGLTIWEPPNPQPGEWYRVSNSNDYYYVLDRRESPTGQRRWDLVYLNRGETIRGFQWDVDDVPGDPYTGRPNMMTYYEAVFTELRNVNQARREAEQNRSEAWIGLQDALHDYLNEKDYETDSVLEQLMEEHGMDKRYEPIQVTISYQGDLMVLVQPGAVQEAVVGFGGEVVGIEETPVHWEATAQVELLAAHCACFKVDENLARSALGLTDEPFTFTTRCAGDQCVHATDEEKPQQPSAA